MVMMVSVLRFDSYNMCKNHCLLQTLFSFIRRCLVYGLPVQETAVLEGGYMSILIKVVR